jgi:hypothetical protein
MPTEMLTCAPARVAPPERALAARLSRCLHAADDARSDAAAHRVWNGAIDRDPAPVSHSEHDATSRSRSCHR